MCSFSLSLITIVTICLTINQSEALPFHRSADTDNDTPEPLVDNDESITQPTADSSSNDEGTADATADGPVGDTKKSVRKAKPVSVNGKVQKTFIRNPNYFRANKLFEKESRKEYILKQYNRFPLPHPGFNVGHKGVTEKATELPDSD